MTCALAHRRTSCESALARFANFKMAGVSRKQRFGALMLKITSAGLRKWRKAEVRKDRPEGLDPKTIAKGHLQRLAASDYYIKGPNQTAMKLIVVISKPTAAERSEIKPTRVACCSVLCELYFFFPSSFVVVFYSFFGRYLQAVIRQKVNLTVLRILIRSGLGIDHGETACNLKPSFVRSFSELSKEALWPFGVMRCGS